MSSPNRKRVLLLPSAKLVPLELQIEFGAIPSGMIPLSSQPAIRYISMPYVEQGFDVLIAVHEQSEHISQYIANHPELNASTVDVGDTGSLGKTVLESIESLGELPQQLVVNFADTYVGDPLPAENVIFYKSQDDVFRWTTFSFDEGKRITQVLDKNVDKLGFGKLPVFVGVFAIADVALFIECLMKALEQRTTGDGLDPFYRAVICYYNQIPEERKVFAEVKDWRDFGHLDTYHATKKQFCMNQRYFNQVTVDTKRGIVRKTSKDVQKFVHEINWYLRLPKSIKYMAPRVFDFSLEHSDPFVEMEFYGYPALNDMYLFGDCDMGIWNQVFIAIENLIQEMRQYHLKPEGTDTLKGAMHDIYYEKTVKRLQPILQDDKFERFCRKHVTINGQTVAGLSTVLETLGDLIETVELYACDHFTIIHGDLCLSNILYDRGNRIIRLVDPRGTFGVFDIYGDPRYDMAKLSHSVEGDYDFYSNGLFDYRWEEDAFYYKPHLEERHLMVKQIFRSRLLNESTEQYDAIKLVESLLFLSMVPLHADRYASQMAFLAKGLEIYSGILQRKLQRV